MVWGGFGPVVQKVQRLGNFSAKSVVEQLRKMDNYHTRLKVIYKPDFFDQVYNCHGEFAARERFCQLLDESASNETLIWFLQAARDLKNDSLVQVLENEIDVVLLDKATEESAKKDMVTLLDKYQKEFRHSRVEETSAKELGDAWFASPNPLPEKKRTSMELPTPSQVEKGILIILNFVNFPAWPPNNKRQGSCSDRDILKKAFKSCGFEVHIYEDLTAQSTRSTIEKIVAELCNSVATDREPDFICFAILSHGSSEVGDVDLCTPDPLEVEAPLYIATSDCKAVSFIMDIKKPLTDRRLAHIDKLFLIQTCRGKDKEKDADAFRDLVNAIPVDLERFRTDDLALGAGTGIATDVPGTLAKLVDTVSFFATENGRESYRHKKDGTYFIVWFCKVLEYAVASENNKRGFDCNHVMYATRHYVFEMHEKLQQPEYDSCFRSHVMLRKLPKCPQERFAISAEQDECQCSLHLKKLLWKKYN